MKAFFDSVIDFFDSIIDFFNMLWTFISNIISGIATAISVLSSAITLPPLLVGFVPSFISTSILVVGSIGVVKLIVGWGNK